jgi:hypothetical protein
MITENKITEALIAEAEQVNLSPELWLRLQSDVKTMSIDSSSQRQGRSKFTPFRWWRSKPWAFAGFVAALVLAIVLAFPSTRSALALWLGLSFDQTNSSNPLVQKVIGHQPLFESGSYEYNVFEFPKDRWSLIQDKGFRMPQQGEQIMLPNGDQLSVPSYLPNGFAWQSVVAGNQSMLSTGFPPLANTSGGGGGLTPMPSFYRSFASFLIGGDQANHFLMLAQFRNHLGPGLSLRTFSILSPDRPPVQGILEGKSPGNGKVTPTPPLQSFKAKLQIGMIIEPSQAENGIRLMVGPDELHEVRVGENLAWWYQGTWDLKGEWNKDSTLTNLVWEQGAYVYQVIGEGIDIETLIRTAESVKRP